MSRELYEFNTKNNSKSWNINAYRISSISGDDLILHPNNNNNIKIEGNIIPSINEKYNLGDNNNKLKYIYVNQINGDVSGNLIGNASTSTKLERKIKIGGIDFTGENNINLPGVNIKGNQDTTGNAETATRLKNLVKLGGINFDGSKDISLAGVNIKGNQDTTGNASTATRLKNLVKLGGINFDGSKDISLAGVNIKGNQDTTGNASTATRLKNEIYIGGVPFDGTKSIDLPGVNKAGIMGTMGIASRAVRLYNKPHIGGVEFDGFDNIDLPGVNIEGNQNTSGKAGSAEKLISDSNNANIILKDNDINYVGLNHNFDGSLNNIQITNLTNDIILIKDKLNAILRRQGLALIS